jgi:hypothetical protein
MSDQHTMSLILGFRPDGSPVYGSVRFSQPVSRAMLQRLAEVLAYIAELPALEDETEPAG